MFVCVIATYILYIIVNGQSSRRIFCLLKLQMFLKLVSTIVKNRKQFLSNPVKI